MDNFQLTPHFSFFEMTTTTHRSLLEKNRLVMNDKVTLGRGYALCAVLLEPIRTHFDKPVVIHSGYRCPELNTAIGGSKSSQHLSFEAADFHVSGVNLEEVFYWIWRDSNLRFGQLILEGWAVGNPTWIHLSLGEPWRDRNNSRQVLTFEAGKYIRLQ